MDLFDNKETEDLLLFVKKFKTTLESSGTIASNAKLNYLCTLLCGEAINQYHTLCSQVGSMTTTHLNQFILGLGT